MSNDMIWILVGIVGVAAVAAIVAAYRVHKGKLSADDFISHSHMNFAQTIAQPSVEKKDE